MASNPLASQLAQNPQMLQAAQAARLAQSAPHAASPFPNYPLLPNAGLMASTMLQMASQRASQAAAHSSDASVASEVSERTRIIPNEIERTEQRPASPATSSETGNEPNVTSDDDTK